MTYVLVMFYFSHMSDTQFIGNFKTHQACINAKVKANPEFKPDAMACVEFTAADLANIKRIKHEHKY